VHTPDVVLQLARSIETELVALRITPLLIGAAALAAHGYPRQTEDIDFAVAIPPRDLEKLASTLAAPGRTLVFAEPDAQDPLGGVLTIAAEGSLPVQIVNFDNPPAGGFPALVRNALDRSLPPADDGPPGRLPSPEDLILFKVYAGGAKSELDILELLTRTRVDLALLRELAEGYGLNRQVDAVLARGGIALEV